MISEHELPDPVRPRDEFKTQVSNDEGIAGKEEEKSHTIMPIHTGDTRQSDFEEMNGWRMTAEDWTPEI